MSVAIFKDGESATTVSSEILNGSSGKGPTEDPFCKYVNLVLDEGMKSSNTQLGRKGVILLENPVGKSNLKTDQLKTEVHKLYFQSDLTSIFNYTINFSPG